jgi:hypothetical protein
MDQHAFVAWVEASEPWAIEKHLLSSGLRVPLNMEGNPCSEDVEVLRSLRSQACRTADQFEIDSRQRLAASARGRRQSRF